MWNRVVKYLAGPHPELWIQPAKSAPHRSLLIAKPPEQ